ncbi:hypothetical protein SI65_01398 [Aspergillus cristatus]|uniref:Sulfotransferase domain-containing protein n=1 Tax=Aspergillus cristatus TaxID=573508 RepID=A0A1E3BS82_ASPCR|nr:hypothetical protein SI65_01398 [Aspergillus cristatus]
MAPSREDTNPPTNGTNPDKSFRILEYSDEEHAGDVSQLIVSDHGYKYRLLEGRVMPPFVTPERYMQSRNVKMRNTDIVYDSYPKSGSTWLSYILVLLTGNKGSSLRDSYHWVENNWLYPRSDAELEAARDPRVFASHMPYDMAVGGDPAQSPAKYIYIARNPKDVCVSYYHFESRKSWAGNYTGDWEHWLQMFMQGDVQRGSWFDHVLGWWRHRDAPNILFLTYEDMKRDIDGQLKKIADFIGAELSADKLEEIKTQIGFSAMKSNEFSGLGDVKELGSSFFRKGQVGSWKEQFTVEQNERFDRLWAERVGEDKLPFDIA